jgi:hypothetical protein
MPPRPELAEGTFLVAEIRSTILAAAHVDKADLAFGRPDPCSEQLQEFLRSQTSTAKIGHRSAARQLERDPRKES